MGLGRWLLASACAAAALGLGLGGSAAETISMIARPLIAGSGDRVTATGAVGSGRADQLVTLQARHCGETSWREVAETTTHEGGSWSVDFQPGISGLFRAVSAGAESAPVKIQQRPSVSLGQRPPGMFYVWVNAFRSFWHKRAVIQRFDTKTRKWNDVRKLLLTETGAPPGVGWVWTGSEKVRVQVPSGTTLRAVLPLSQAKPCYLAGYSNLLRR